MMLLMLAAALQAGPPAPAADQARYDRCLDLAQNDPAAAREEATRWRIAGGAWFARQCAGMAFTRARDWRAAAQEFEAAAREAQGSNDSHAAQYWAQAGNAWLAANDAARARSALDAALATGTLTGLQRGEAQLDHARALVAGGELEAARTDIDLALTTAGDDPLAWLLSATLARRADDLPLARKHIAEALARASDDASVQLEAGNIAALAGDAAAARAAWGQAARLAPDSAAATSATAALRQFDAPAGTPVR